MKDKRFYLTIKLAEPTMPAFGAYVAGSVKEDRPDKLKVGEVLLNLECILQASLELDGFDWREVATDTITHELIHVIQDLLGNKFAERGVNKMVEKARARLEGK